ncbi:hypothetical protein R3P38DRAFT_3026718 [Favolaschia claudopus]|uniref:F-box domain-containing protein n=1 Tax=Favolaschia claudopus TaxID=2862362 RepID=A0AAW0AF52_9AGAR
MDLNQLMIGPLSNGNLLDASGSQSFEKLVKTLIAAAQENISRIDSQIKDLKCMRDREYGLIASLKLVISPIRKLPDEILAIVFRLAIDTFYVSRIICALRVSQVCKHWRQLAHRTPHLWTEQPSIRYDNRRGYSAEYIAATKVYLDRSAPLPISFHISSAAKPPKGTRFPPALVDVLFSAASRWKTLTLSGPPEIHHALAQLPPNSLPLLEEVALFDSLVNAPAFLCAPCLRSITLHASGNIATLLMPWAQLTNLRLTTVGFCTWLDTFLQCTNLVHAVLYAEPADDDAQNNAPAASNNSIATLPFLESIDVSLLGDQVAPLFGRLALPRVHRIEISFINTHDTAQWSLATSTIFSQFQLRSPNIADLSLTVCDISPDELHAILLHSPCLTDLLLECCPDAVDDAILERLQYVAENAVHLAPRLQTLCLYPIGDSFAEESLLSMIRSRWWTTQELQALPAPPPVARWQRVDITCYDADEFSEFFYQQLSDLKAQGLDIDVRTP